MNAGPGAVAGLFVHQKHGQVDLDKLDGDDGGGGEEEAQAYRPRLSGWWGGDKSLRFRMDTRQSPSPWFNP
jgi:kynureninase